jgi:hypothetical protein
MSVVFERSLLSSSLSTILCSRATTMKGDARAWCSSENDNDNENENDNDNDNENENDKDNETENDNDNDNNNDNRCWIQSEGPMG